MFKLLSVLLFVIVKVESEQIECEMVPIKTENGLQGYCCMFLKNASNQQKRDKFLEIINKNSNLRNVGTQNQPNRPIIQPEDWPEHNRDPQNHRMIFDDERSRITENRPPIHSHGPPPFRMPPHKPIRQNPKPGENSSSEKMTKSHGRETVQKNISGDDLYVKNISATARDSSITVKNDNNTDKNVALDNRFNINAPKTCTGSSKMTNTGECETPFG